ncbi:MAG: hypothetical protein H7246_07315 [Phycisphaerae bacterium]|nr:hypothetical protein [Saprospiraceae bacterium]
MPIEIIELAVRAKVNEQPNAQASRASNNNANSAQSNDNDPNMVQVKKSVEAILDVLKRKNER